MTVRAISDNDLDRALLTDITKFEDMLARYRAGDVDEDVFRSFRLSNGVYGQRQGNDNQMIRVKVPYGSLTPEQLDLLGDLVESHSRGFGHITSRQNIQFHFVHLDAVPEVLRLLASVGLTTREACGDVVRNVQGCHLAGACPVEILDITQWAEAAYRLFLRNPIAQRLPRKFKVNFSGCATDCGQAMFNDIGVIAVATTDESGATQVGFRVYVAGGLGANPHPALALEPFTTREDLLPTLEAILRVFDQAGNRENKLRARMKWLVDTIGFDEVQRRVMEVRRLLPASSSYPGGIPHQVHEFGDEPAAGIAVGEITTLGQGTPVQIRGVSPFDRWSSTNVVRGVRDATVSVYAHAFLGDITGDQFRGLAGIQRAVDADVRITNRQNVVFRGIDADRLGSVHAALVEIGMASPGAEFARDVVACPGADTCNLAITQSRGLAKAIDAALEDAALAEVGGIRINISGCTNSCGHHHVADIGFHGVERRSHGESVPGYQMLVGGYVGDERIEFAQRVCRLPAKNVPAVVVRLVGAFSNARDAGETFAAWIDRAGGIAVLRASVEDLTVVASPAEAPEFYTDFDESVPFAVTLGESECA
ncbi:MAG: nitrite/sulfite reductase [Acidobacteria bacterium]|nr:nitrite/sulfite reductase [Acidobacteriota bacterium]